MAQGAHPAPHQAPASHFQLPCRHFSALLLKLVILCKQWSGQSFFVQASLQHTWTCKTIRFRATGRPALIFNQCFTTLPPTCWSSERASFVLFWACFNKWYMKLTKLVKWQSANPDRQGNRARYRVGLQGILSFTDWTYGRGWQLNSFISRSLRSRRRWKRRRAFRPCSSVWSMAASKCTIIILNDFPLTQGQKRAAKWGMTPQLTNANVISLQDRWQDCGRIQPCRWWHSASRPCP